jgi:soluble lytic murein transglycosylase
MLWSAGHAATLEEQRALYKRANQALVAGESRKFAALAAQLKDYPLYPYLVYEVIRGRLSKADGAEINKFLTIYPDLPISKDLRRNRLGFLARNGRWQEFLDLYDGEGDKVLQCYYLRARMQLRREENLLADIRDLWLAGESLPRECDPVFTLLYGSALMTDDLVWQRFRLALGNNDPILASYLSRRLSAPERIWAQRWMETHNNPARGTSSPVFADTPQAREILVHGITRLARVDVARALTHWDALEKRYDFAATESARARRELAIRAARDGHPRAGELLDAIAATDVDDSILHWRLVTAIAKKDWENLIRWTEVPPPDSLTPQRWLYWRGRALEETGRPEEARETFSRIQKERDYYGFLARDRLGIAYEMNHRELPAQPEVRREVAAFPHIERARELHFHGMRSAARREWQALLDRLAHYQLQIAATIAAEWGWHDQAILTLGKAMAYDDLLLRFPVAFEDTLRKYAAQRKLDLAWMYALVRAESAFLTDARSVSGALGLMQLLPATARETAQRIGFRTYANSYLLEADKNITLGSAYLKQMLDRFDGNLVLATAAYNAGPGAVQSWLPTDACLTPEVWIELIPYEETRKYVSRILYFASIYDWRLQQEITSVRDRMSTIPTRKSLQAAGPQCDPPAVAMNGGH